MFTVKPDQQNSYYYVTYSSSDVVLNSNPKLMNVLIIDDDAEDTELFCLALKEAAPDINCLVMHNPKTGLSSLENGQEIPQYIFLDGHMHLVDGKDCLLKLRAMQSLRDTKIIIYSGHLSEKQIQEYKALGADRYIHKPSSFENLRILLATMFGERKAS